MKWWASLGITRARYDDEGKYVTRVELHKIHDGVVQEKSMVSRDRVVELMELGFFVVTIREKSDGGIQILNPLHLSETMGGAFIRVDDEDEPRDQLGRLPEL